jgi:hypothetical protein
MRESRERTDHVQVLDDAPCHLGAAAQQPLHVLVYAVLVCEVQGCKLEAQKECSVCCAGYAVLSHKRLCSFLAHAALAQPGHQTHIW